MSLLYQCIPPTLRISTENFHSLSFVDTNCTTSVLPSLLRQIQKQREHRAGCSQAPFDLVS
ncbi:hypothetical protein CY34DRAFT_810219 [Suillus luteus UH-Slu-Lm8-n1]|uniref:Uncharacterized protein n=1 Tax=Suillus luteus UH-Slu-Lm8-n1 TaxID=930992 RepID=A0A0D0A7G5_9AGAM|nr:hypothetical protein CY34DRAFT_810219 [Suillus luteus UH-Slu-Lm8-n1]